MRRRPAAPAPLASARGSAARMVATVVIRMGTASKHRSLNNDGSCHHALVAKLISKLHNENGILRV